MKIRNNCECGKRIFFKKICKLCSLKKELKDLIEKHKKIKEDKNVFCENCENYDYIEYFYHSILLYSSEKCKKPIEIKTYKQYREQDQPRKININNDCPNYEYICIHQDRINFLKNFINNN